MLNRIYLAAAAALFLCATASGQVGSENQSFWPRSDVWIPAANGTLVYHASSATASGRGTYLRTAGGLASSDGDVEIGPGNFSIGASGSGSGLDHDPYYNGRGPSTTITTTSSKASVQSEGWDTRCRNLIIHCSGGEDIDKTFGSAAAAGSDGDIQTNSSGSLGAITPGSGISAWLATPSSANLADAVSDETGGTTFGGLVFSDGPSFANTVTLTGRPTVLTGGFGGSGHLVLSTSGTAALGFQYNSSTLELTGHGWDTGSGASRSLDWKIYNAPTQGNPATSALNFDYQYNSGGYSTKFVLGSDGTFKDGSGNSLNPRAKTVIIAAADTADALGADVKCTGTSGGTHTDNVAIAAAINAAPTGSIVMLRKGHYYCNAAMTITNDVTIIGEGTPAWGSWGGVGLATNDTHGAPGGAQLIFYGSPAYGINSDVYRVTIHNLYLRTDNGSGSYTLTGVGIRANGPDFTIVDNCFIAGWSVGLMAGGDTGRYHHNWISKNTWGIQTIGSGDSLITDNVVYTTQYGIVINTTRNRIYHNQVADFTNAGVYANSSGSDISHNQIFNGAASSSTAIQLDSGADRTKIHGNMIDLLNVIAANTSGHGIQVGATSHCDNCTITGNTFYSDGAGTSTGYAVTFQNSSTNNVCIGNDISGGRWNAASSATISAGSGNLVAWNKGDNQTISTPLTVTAGKSLSVTNSLTLSGTDSTTMTFPPTSATIARTDAANTFTGHQTIEGVTSTGATGTGNLVFATSPTFTTPLLGTPTSGTLSNCTTATLAAGTTSTALANAAFIDAVLPKRCERNHLSSVFVAGTKAELGFDPGSDYQVYTYNSTQALNDEFTNDFAVRAGTYSFDFWVYRDGNRGIVTVSVDGSSIGTIDSYNASADRSKLTIAGVSVASGWHKLNIKVTSKNGSSTSYYFACSQIIIHQTSD